MCLRDLEAQLSEKEGASSLLPPQREAYDGKHDSGLCVLQVAPQLARPKLPLITRSPPNKNHANMAATAKFFATYELLEPTLLHLPLRDLLLAQGINEACFDVIERSHDIRRALFFEGSANPLDAEALWGETERIVPVVNPFIKM